MEITNLRKVQLEIVKMMEEIDNLFSSYNIKYTLLGGSVLGAIRHKGFIPWDDDMDIGIMRNDFKKAEDILLTFSSYLYEPAEKLILPGAPIGHLHLINENYTIENSPTIDIFALDTVPVNKKEQEKLRFWANLHHLSTFRKAPRNRGKLKKISIGFLIYLIPNIFWDYIQKKTLDKIISFCDRNSTTMIGNIWGFWTEKEYFEKEIYESIVKFKFENLLLPIPKNYDLYLTQLYGNYMQLPPEKDRIPKHMVF